MNILVIGDVMVDVNYISTTNRRAPEADIPIYEVEEIKYILGGAANVAQNLHHLHANVEIISVVGNDEMGDKIQDILKEKQIKCNILIDSKRKTTQKNRIFQNNTLITRYDIEETNDINDLHVETLLQYIYQKKNVGAIVLSDYAKGVVTTTFCKKIIKYCNANNIYTFVDPKIQQVDKYANCFCFKPNAHEGQMITKQTKIEDILINIQNILSPKYTILTCGDKGIYINNTTKHIQHETQIHVKDVTGAGDIVLCILVFVFLQSKDMVYATKIANYIAGKSVQTIGNYIVSLKDINEYDEMEKRNIEIMNKHKNQDQSILNSHNKVLFDHEREKIKELSKRKNIVFTNGCFDIIHSGHIQNLQFAKSQGDILVVGLNTDASVKRLKGEKRPINNEEERSLLLSLFHFVDYIILFQEDTPLSILKLLQPTTLVKGSDYKKEQIIGSEYVEKVVLFDYIEGKSSTCVINKILNTNKKNE